MHSRTAKALCLRPLGGKIRFRREICGITATVPAFRRDTAENA